MSLDRISQEGITRRNVLQATLALPLLTAGSTAFGENDPVSLEKILTQKVTARQKAIFDAAKKLRTLYDKLNDKKKQQQALKYNSAFINYLDMLLVKDTKIVYDAKRNKDGFVSAFFYWPDQKHREQAVERMHKATGNSKEQIESTRLQTLLNYIIIPCRVGGVPGRKEKECYFVIDDSIFKQSSADEFFSLLDYAATFAHRIEYGITVNGRNLDFSQRDSLYTCHTDIFNLDAYSFKLTNILNKNRNIDNQDFLSKSRKDYLAAYAKCKLSIDENSGFTHTTSTLRKFIKTIDKRMESIGYRHVQGFGYNWSLEKIPGYRAKK